MKNCTSDYKIYKLILIFTLVVILITGGCYEIESIIQPDKVDVNKAFNVRINVRADPNGDFIPAYGFLGILLPEGWKVKDSVSYYKTGRYSKENAFFIYSDYATNFIINNVGLPPAGYYWWGARSLTQIELRYDDSGNINIEITSGSKPGQFDTKYVLCNDNEWDELNLKISLKSLVVHSKKLEINNEVNVYPNPATEKVTFTWNGNTELLNLKMYNTNGTCVTDIEISSNENVDVSGFPPGIYLYHLSKDNELIKTGKLVID